MAKITKTRSGGLVAIWLVLLLLLSAGVAAGTWYTSKRQGRPSPEPAVSLTPTPSALRNNKAESIVARQQPSATRPLASKPAEPSIASSTLVKILTEPTLWGKDFPAVLAYLDGWAKIGEPKVTLSSIPNRVVGSITYKTREDAQQAAERLALALKEPQPNPNPKFAGLIKSGIISQSPPFRSEAIPFVRRDSFRVAWTAASLQFLPQSKQWPTLTLRHVQELLGPPEKTTSELFGSSSDMRPNVLTLHVYAGGAVTFVESDLASGFVAEAILDVPTVTAALFQEGQ